MVRPSSPSVVTNFFFSAAGMVRRLPAPSDLGCRLPQKQKRSRGESRVRGSRRSDQRHKNKEKPLESTPA